MSETAEREAHRTGNYVRYGPNRLLIREAEAVKGEWSCTFRSFHLLLSTKNSDIFGHGSAFNKGIEYQVLQRNKTISSFLTEDIAAHRQKRKLMSYGFSDTALKTAEPILLHYIGLFCDHLLQHSGHWDRSGDKEELWTSAKDVGTWSKSPYSLETCASSFNKSAASYLALDIVSHLAFGRSFETLTKPDFRYVVNAVKNAKGRMAVAFEWPEAFRSGQPGQWMDLGTWIFPKVDSSAMDWLKTSQEWTLRRIAEHQERVAYEAKPRDILTHVIDAVDPDTGTKLSSDEVVAEAFALMTAGADTASAGLASVFFYLSRNPAACSAVVNELRSTFPTVDDVTWNSTLSSCPYLRACINEALRMSPAACVPLWREVQHPAGGVVCGHQLPLGVSCGVGAYALHHDERAFPDSFSFCPERWLSGSENPYSSCLENARAAFVPFSYGPRNCLGMGFAYMELTLTVGRLLWLADIRIPRTDHMKAKIGEGGWSGAPDGRHRKNEFQIYDCFGADKEGPWLEFKLR